MIDNTNCACFLTSGPLGGSVIFPLSFSPLSPPPPRCSHDARSRLGSVKAAGEGNVLQRYDCGCQTEETQSYIYPFVVLQIIYVV